MIATSNCLLTLKSLPFFDVAQLRKPLGKWTFCFVTWLLFFPIPAAWSQPPISSFSARVEVKFINARKQFNADAKNPEAALNMGQAAFDWADVASDNEKREKIALEGIVASRRLISLQPKSAAGHYYLAMNLGQLAKTKKLGALRLVDEMEAEFHSSRACDEKFDFAGPDRNLGLLYFEAPGWPTSIGSRAKARHHLQRAVLLCSNYPDNRLNLIEAYLRWGDKPGGQREFEAAKKFWPIAKKEFAGERWVSSWVDWDKRWGKIQSRFAELEKTMEAPRQK